MNPNILSNTEYSNDFCLPLESCYICASVNRGKETFKDSDLLGKETLPYPFNFLNVVKTKRSSGKCWVFHKSQEVKLIGYLFPSVFRILGIKWDVNLQGEFFIENRNFLRIRHGLLGVAFSKQSVTGQVNLCEIILITKLYVDEKGEMIINYLRYLEKNL